MAILNSATFVAYLKPKQRKQKKTQINKHTTKKEKICVFNLNRKQLKNNVAASCYYVTTPFLDAENKLLELAIKF